MYYTNVYTALVFDSRAPHVAGKLGGSKQGAGFKKLWERGNQHLFAVKESYMVLEKDATKVIIFSIMGPKIAIWRRRRH